MTAQAGGASPLPSSHPVDASTARSTAGQTMDLKLKIRREMRRRRRELSPRQQRDAGRRIVALLERSGCFQAGRRIGVYLAMPDELPLDLTVRAAWRRGCHVFVPHIQHRRHARMTFHSLTTHSRLRTDRWGIPQLAVDATRQPISPLMLDVVLVPLLAFDIAGHRLGMGAGYYDRYFARLQRNARWHKPRLIGVAHAFQQVEALPTQRHDVALDAIVTPDGLLHARHLAD